MAKPLSKEDRQFLLSLKQDDLGIKMITRLFGKTAKKENGKMIISTPRFDTKSKLHLKKGEYINTQDVETTVGSFLFNKLMVEGMLEPCIPGGYFNEVVNNSGMSHFLKFISEGVMQHIIPIDPNLTKWLKQYEFYGMKASTIFSPSYTEGLLRHNSKVMKTRNELIEKNKDADITKMVDIEDTIVSMARKELKGDPGMTLFDSGARGDFSNDYKNMNLSLGAVAKPGKDGEFDFVKSNYLDGLQKEDMVPAGNTIVNSAYPKAIGTQEAGYLTKKFFSAYQSITVDEPGTDCGSKKGLEFVLTEEDGDSFDYQYNIEGNKLVCITPENRAKYIGKKVKLRSPMFCSGDKICSICAGKRWEIMGIKNIGLTAGRITNTLLNASMKNFHNSKVKLDHVDINDLIV